MSLISSSKDLVAHDVEKSHSQHVLPGDRKQTSLLSRFASVLICITCVTVALIVSVTLFPSAWTNWVSLPERQAGSTHQSLQNQALLKHVKRAVGDRYLLGVGKADITGPVVEINFMGYAESAQIGTGLRQRLYARSFIVGDVNNATDRFVYVSADIAAGDTAIRYGILQGLAKLGPAYSVYTKNNVAITGTHSHSGPGAYFNYLLPQVTSLGFSKESYQAIVDGTVLSIKRAHDALAPGHLAYADTEVEDANISRSPSAYLANPASERAKYRDNVDKTLTVLKFQRASDGLNTGILAWHNVHATAMYANNTKVTGDHKGVSSYLFERAMQRDKSAAPGFVAAFSQGNMGDVTPNVEGAWCDDGSGQQCSFDMSTCNGNAAVCHGRGPFFEKLDLGVSSTYEIGRRVYQGAKTLYDSFDSKSTTVKDSSVKAYHTYNDMRYYKFPSADGSTVQTCPAALGYAFAAGTTDWPGPLDFSQGNNGSLSGNPFWSVVSKVVSNPSPEQKACHLPKPILLNVGEMTFPYAWSPNIVDVQSFRVGQLIIALSPSELSTMTGRRWRNALSSAAVSQSIVSSGTTPKIVLGSPANTYAHYCVTKEEYGVQRYEGASTLYGQYTSEAYIYLSTSNVKYLKGGASTPSPPAGPSPPINIDSSLSFITGVVHDQAPVGNYLGQVITQPSTSYTLASSPIIKATFWGANPRNNYRLEGTFASVEKQQADGTWKQVRSDYDWALVYEWTRVDGFWGTSRVEIKWEVESWAEKGVYRIRYYGDGKAVLTGKITAFTGTSAAFSVV